MIAAGLYVAACLVGIVAALELQTGRHQAAKACVWWAYTVLAFGLGWEAIDALRFGAPDFPSSRWVLVPAIAVVQAGAALKDRLAGRTVRAWWRDLVA